MHSTNNAPMHSSTNDTPHVQQDQGDYEAVVMETPNDQEDDEKSDKQEHLSAQQQLYKWARSGDSKKLKEFVQEQRQLRSVDIKEFLSFADDGSHEQEESEKSASSKQAGGCFGGDDEEEQKPKFSSYHSGNTALHMAALHANAAFCKDLFELGAKFTDVKNSLNSSPLHLAASSGHADTLTYILEKYVSGNNTSTALKEKNKIGNTPIHCAVYSGSVECLKILFQRCEKEDIDFRVALMERNHTGTQALRYAATQEMKVFINAVFNPDPDEQKDNNENDNDIDDGEGQNNGITEVES